MTLVNSLSHLIQYYRKRTSEDYLYDDWSEDKYKEYLRNRTILPFYGYLADLTIGKHNNDYYMKRNGLTWDDVKQPWNLPGYSLEQSSYNGLVQTASRGINFVSSNVTRLYRDDNRRRR